MRDIGVQTVVVRNPYVLVVFLVYLGYGLLYLGVVYLILSTDARIAFIPERG